MPLDDQQVVYGPGVISFDWPVIFGTVVLALQIGLRLFALGVIPGGRRPSTGMAWLLLILVEPFIGFAIFLLFGRTDVGRRREERQRAARDAINELNQSLEAPATNRVELDPATLDPTYLRNAVRLNTRLGAPPLLGGNRAELIADYADSVTAMAAAVDTAETFVHVEFYITAWDDVTDRFFQALVRATERGVRVRLLFDHIGSHGIPVYRELLRRLGDTKIEWHPMLPIQPLRGRWRRPDLRNHRKILVIDGRIGFTGSMNLIEPGYDKPANHKLGREWVELVARVEGPVVAALNEVFAADWFTETHTVPDVPGIPATDHGRDLPCQLIPSGPGYESENNLRLFTTLIYNAHERISLTSPYFVPDESMLYAVTTAAQRGIDVELFVSELADQFMVGHAQASYYRALLEAGVRIYQYPAPYILHAKHFTIDDAVAVVGSSNMDMRSFSLNYEISLMMLGPEIVASMRSVEDHYRSISKPLTLEEWRRRPARLKFVDNVCRLSAALQ